MTKLLVVPLALALGATTALAEGRSARLLDDAPKLAMGAAPRLLPVVLGHGESEGDCGCECECAPPMGYGELFTKTAAVGVVASAAGVMLGAGLGTLSNNLIGAALPVLLANLFVPPIVTVLVAMLLGNWDSPGRFGFWLPVAGAFVVNAAVYVLTSLVLQIAVAWTNPVAMLLYTLVDGVLMSGATVGIMALTEKKPDKTAVIPSFVPGVSATTFVPLTTVKL
ncbi:MAG: hypothetical protein ACOZQL_31655 [Myxococcota bacterium]